MAINSSGRCEHCGALIRNTARRRRTIEQLTSIHEETCPGLHRNTRKERT